MEGCRSFFCTGVAPPRMRRSRTARGTRGRDARRGSQGLSLGSRSRQESCLELLVRKQEEQVEKKPFDLLPHLIRLVLLPGEPTGSAAQEPVLAGLVHGFLPAVIADPGAQSQHRIDIAAFPVHPRSFEPFLDDATVGAL